MIDLTATMRGVTLGEWPYKLKSSPEAVLSTAGIRTGDEPRPLRDGLIAGPDFLAGKTLAFEVQIDAGDRASSEIYASELSEAFAVSGADEWLDVRIAGGPSEYSFRGRARGCDIGIDRQRFVSGLIDARCVFVATDPVRYGPSRSHELGLAAHTIPANLPFVLGLYGQDSITVDGAANIERWTVTFEAPASGVLVNPRILHVEQNQLVQADVSVPVNNQIVFDGYSGRAVIGVFDQSIVPTSVSQWFALTPGVNTLRFSAADGSDVDSTATVVWRSGWK